VHGRTDGQKHTTSSYTNVGRRNKRLKLKVNGVYIAGSQSLTATGRQLSYGDHTIGRQLLEMTVGARFPFLFPPLPALARSSCRPSSPSPVISSPLSPVSLPSPSLATTLTHKSS